jgi:hypothetical protein
MRVKIAYASIVRGNVEGFEEHMLQTLGLPSISKWESWVLLHLGMIQLGAFSLAQ